MLDTKFYFNTIRRVVTAFGTIFNNISIDRVDASDVTQKTLDCPLQYDTWQRYLGRIRNDTKDPQIGLTLPRLSFHLDGIQYDSTRQINPIGYKTEKNDTDADLMKKIMNPIPFNYNFELGIYTKNTEDGLQILEQILPYFSPTFNLTIIDVPAYNITKDIPITLDSISPQDNYESNFVDDERIYSWLLGFTIDGYMYLPIKDGSVIKKITANLQQDKDLPNASPATLHESLGISVNPQSAFIDDMWDTDKIVTPGPNNPA